VTQGWVSLDDLRSLVSDGEVDIVELVVVDMQGRLQGKRVTAQHFLDEVVERGTEAQNYVFATDVEMSAIGGYDSASWATGYGNMIMRPDTASMRRLPWHPGSVLALCDAHDRSNEPVRVSPRQILRSQVERLASRQWSAVTGAELEFQLFDNTYEEAWREGYRSLRPASQYGSDYGMLDTRGNGVLLSQLTRQLAGAGVGIEAVLSEAALGQHEIVLSRADALTTSDNHALAKFGAKQVVAAAGKSMTFMAKLDEHEGNACHVHFSLRDAQGDPLFAGDDNQGFSTIMRSFLAGQLEFLPELTLLLAPNVNSYKRFTEGSYAPTVTAWGFDNRTCALRVVGQGHSLRFEHRLPGGDVNLHVAMAAVIAAGMRGVEEQLQLGPPLVGNAYISSLPRVPSSLGLSIELFRNSKFADEAFGADVVSHFVRMGEVELEEFGRSVTDWEKVRGFERM
jgi:glutamine synthetase